MIRKLLYYSDSILLGKIALAALRFGWVSFWRGREGLLSLTSPLGKKRAQGKDEEKITKYVALYFLLRRKLSCRDTCFNRSLFLCFILRGMGLERNVNFGAKKINEKLVGHCWLDSSEVEGYQVIHRYP